MTCIPRIKQIVRGFCLAMLALAGFSHAQGTTFAYQGRLQVGGAPANGTFDMRFQAWQALSGGLSIGGLQTINDVPVQNGLFTVELNLGGGVFTSSNRWLQIQIRPGASTGSFTALSPRQPILPVPYAIYSREAGLLDGLDSTEFSPTTHSHTLGQTPAPPILLAANLPASPILRATNLGTTPDAVALHGSRPAPVGTAPAILGESNVIESSGNAILGRINSTTPGAYSAGVRGINNGTGGLGIGVYGSQAGAGWGVYGTAPSGIGVFGSGASGTGVFGNATSGTGVTGNSSTGTGVAGSSSSGVAIRGTTVGSIAVQGSYTGTTGVGPAVLGESDSTESNNIAILGRINSTAPGAFSAAVRGINNGTGGLGIGVYGSQAGGGWGVYGTTSSGIGVNGIGNSGTGVFGSSSSGNGVSGSSGTGIGVVGTSSSGVAIKGTSSANIAVQGSYTSTTGVGPAVLGESDSTDANSYAILGRINPTSPGGFSAAVRGINNGTGGLGIGVYGSQAGSGWGVYGTAPSGLGVYGNSTSTGTGVYGNSNSGSGLWGVSSTGSAARLSTTSAANTNPAVQIDNAGSGYALNATGTGPDGKGMYVATAPNSNEVGLNVANGSVVLAPQEPYISGAPIDNAVLRIAVPGAYALPPGQPEGMLVWVVNTTPVNVTIINVEGGALTLPGFRFQQFIYLPSATPVNWFAAM